MGDGPKVATFARTRLAAKGDKKARWDLISAIAEDAVGNDLPITSEGSVLAAKNALDEAGTELSPPTVKDLTITAKFDWESSPDQRRVWRRYGWTAIRTVAKAGWDPNKAMRFLDSPRLRSFREIEAKARQTGWARGRATPEDLDLNAAWHGWLTRLNTLLTQGAQLADRSEQENTPLDAYGSAGHLIYERITERKLDAEIRTFFDQAEAGEGR